MAADDVKTVVMIPAELIVNLLVERKPSFNVTGVLKVIGPHGLICAMSFCWLSSFSP